MTKYPHLAQLAVGGIACPNVSTDSCGRFQGVCDTPLQANPV